MSEKLTFAEKLEAATNEDKQVNPIYVNAISSNLNRLGGGMDESNPDYALYTDGIFNCYYLNEDREKEWFILQLECKQDVDLCDGYQFARVMVQVMYYMKQMSGKMSMPKVIVLGTKKNCMALPAVIIDKKYIKQRNYPEYDENGHKISASTAPDHPLYRPLLNEVERDAELQSVTRVIEVVDKNAAKELCIDILKIAKDLGIKEEMSAENLSRAFDFFDMKVLTEKSRKNLSSRVKAEAFMQLMLNPKNVQADFRMDALGNRIYSGTMNFNGTIIEVDGTKFNSFANVFAIREYSIPEQKKVTEITDRLIEDTDRRRRGDFYTPTIWVDEAHKLLEKNLGENWRKECIVWDCAWGTGNLTRDYSFGELYCSTLEESDLKIGEKYNTFSTKFKYDFLNDDVEEFESLEYLMWEPFIGTPFYKHKNIEPHVNLKEIADLYAQAVEKNVITDETAKDAYIKIMSRLHNTKLYELAPKLIESLLSTDKPLVFFINPPYGTSKNNSTNKENNSKAGIAKTGIRDVMAGKKLGMAQRQLYAQFLFRCIEIMRLFGNKGAIGAFTQSDFLTTVSYGEFRKYLYGNSKYLDGFQFSGGYFDKVKQYVGLTFTIWDTSQKTNEQISIDIVDLGETPDKLNVIGKKDVIIPEKLFNVEIRDTLAKAKKTKQKKECLALKSGLNVREDEPVTLCLEGSLGGFQCNSNDVNQNAQRVALFSSQFFGPANMDIIPETFCDAMTLFTARRLIVPDWINWKDEYAVPNKDDERYAQFEADSIVYSLFESKSQQTSMRNLFYNGKTWDIYNEFFWLSRESMLKLAGGETNPLCTNNTVYNDIMQHAKSERFVYEKLQTVKLSDDAKFVLDFATAILIDTFKYRDEFDKKHPEYHINTWDAGWYQIKAVAKEYIPEQLKQFNNAYRQLEDRMRPLVYDLGFLYK